MGDRAEQLTGGAHRADRPVHGGEAEDAVAVGDQVGVVAPPGAAVDEGAPVDRDRGIDAGYGAARRHRLHEGHTVGAVEDPQQAGRGVDSGDEQPAVAGPLLDREALADRLEARLECRQLAGVGQAADLRHSVDRFLANVAA